MFEYTCHEGSYELLNILTGARVQELTTGKIEIRTKGNKSLQDNIDCDLYQDAIRSLDEEEIVEVDGANRYWVQGRTEWDAGPADVPVADSIAGMKH